jgi:predicted CoA-substrate-specific enzyme activase
MALSVGIDVGSVAVKAVAVAEDRPLAWLEERTTPDIPAQCSAMLGEIASRCGGAPGRVCSTGYGRRLVAEAASHVSEIMANAVGVGWLHRHWRELGEVFGEPPTPGDLSGPVRTIVDVGGQDSKVILLDADGMIRDFVMNDRCAAGTGRFLEVMARVLEVDLRMLDALAGQAGTPAAISSACTVFAESEVVSLLSEGASREAVAAGVFESVADQVTALAAGTGWEAPVLFDGGPSHSLSLRNALARRLGCEPAVPPCAQFATALGAAMAASDGRSSS